jgi:two-component system, chemotaxis family, protein-glutamate methylesterase/glutaminase
MTETGTGKNSNDRTVQRIIVIGGSTGGFEAFKTIVQKLPPDLGAAVFIVWHMSADVNGLLPQVLNRENTLVASNAVNNEPIQNNHIYVAPPDHHLLVREGKVQITRGPKENRFRPAVDPLFRSAAYTYGNRVIGIILSGGLDDGTAGLWTIKHYGGIAVVQHPEDAQVSSMPENAIRQVKVDHIVPASEIAALIVRLLQEPVSENNVTMRDEQTKKEIDIAAEENGMEHGFLKFGELTPYSCPECHGVLSRLQNGDIVRYRCHTGHAYTADVLITAITEKIEDSLYNAIRGIDESIMLLNHIGDHYAEVNEPRLAALYFKKANEAEDRAQLVRKAAKMHEQFSKDSLRQEAGE